MNFLYPWQFLAFGSCLAQLILTAPCSLLLPLVMSRPLFDWSTKVKWWKALTMWPSLVCTTPMGLEVSPISATKSAAY